MSLAYDRAYAYARACGGLARSFLGERAASLARCSRVSEAWRAVFDEPPPELPETSLAAAAEIRLAARATEALVAVAGSRALDIPIFRALARKRESAYLKRAVAAAIEGAASPPEPSDPKIYDGFFLDAFPDVERMVRGTHYQWIAEAGTIDLPAVKNGLDRQYYRELWTAAGEIPASRSGALLSLIKIEAELENVAWALRLARYYSMQSAEIEALLMDLPGTEIRAPALAALGFRADARGDWRGWKWERLVPDSRKDGGGTWRLDLRGLESAADAYLYRRLARALHMEADTLVPLYSFYKIKEMEAAAIRGVMEGIRLEAPEAEIAAFAAERTGGAA
jgi:hypothetical protein